MAKSIKIVVSSMVYLVPVRTRQGVTRVAEHYANWETGNTFEVPANADEQTIVEKYREAVVANFS